MYTVKTRLNDNEYVLPMVQINLNTSLKINGEFEKKFQRLKIQYIKF